MDNANIHHAKVNKNGIEKREHRYLLFLNYTEELWSNFEGSRKSWVISHWQ